ncbi:MAG: adenylate/guanylate cyclase domain-containing protein [Candidatus Latescibacter sp.]|nr:adenylate/guanylate cyclase domain-containing protein [Candidatus Latescibacter sp.]
MKKVSVKNRKIILDIALVLTIFILAAILLLNDSLFEFNGKLFNFLVQKRRSVEHTCKNVVIVCVDQQSLDEYYRKERQSWPWPRDFHAQLVRYLTECGAKAIVFDVIFSEQDIDRVNADAKPDKVFGEAIAESGRTFLVCQVYAVTDSLTFQSASFDEKAFLSDDGIFRGLRIRDHRFAAFPLPVLAEGTVGIGLSNIESDRDDIIRNYPLALKLNGRYIPSLGFAVSRNILGDKEINKRLGQASSIIKRVDSRGNLLLNWYGKGGVDGVFTYYSYRAVLQASIREERTGKPDTLSSHFRDKIVLVGSNAPGLLDLKATPFTSFAPYPGVEIHATAIENFLADDFISTVPPWIRILAMAAASILLFYGFKIFRNLRLLVALFLGFMIVEVFSSYFLILNNIWLPGVDIYLVSSLVFVGLVISGYVNETKEKRILRGHFERYVNDSVLSDILANPDAIDLKGRTIIATVMASDIADFTNISEKLHAYELVARLNDYFSEVSEALITNGAFINKYIGDAILSIYGAFGEEPEHRRKACRAALAAHEVINRKIEQARTEGRDPFLTRIGINTGEMTLGNIGSARKIEYTVIGDSVNSAFRLEGINKFYNTRILVSEFTKEGVEDEFEFRLIDSLLYKGKDMPVSIYELLGVKGNVNPEILRLRDEFEQALDFYRKREFQEAGSIFARLHEEGDGASGVMRMRCDHFLSEPPPPEWDGVWKMLRK